MKKIKLSEFVGRQLSRLKLGQTYYMLIMSTVSALSLVSMAFPDINFLIFIFLFPLILLGTFFVGYFLDKSNVTTMDQIKTIEMTSRYLNTVDYKNNDFRMLQMESIFKWLESINNKEPLDPSILKEKYKKFLKKWNPSEEK